MSDGDQFTSDNFVSANAFRQSFLPIFCGEEGDKARSMEIPSLTYIEFFFFPACAYFLTIMITPLQIIIVFALFDVRSQQLQPFSSLLLAEESIILRSCELASCCFLQPVCATPPRCTSDRMRSLLVRRLRC